MVKINKRSRRRLIEENFSFKSNKYLNRHFLHLFILVLIGLTVTLALFLISKEQRESASLMASAHSTQRIVTSGKPFLLYGTAWKKDDTAKYVQQAITAGFRFIDTACQPKHYNENGVGDGWTAAARALGLERADIFLQTKYTPMSGQDPHRVPYDASLPLEDQVQHSLQVSLDNLQTEYLDSLVLHSPLPTFEETMRVWRQFETFMDQGTVRRLGISNCYELDYFTRLYDAARIKPSVLQNRFYADSNFDTDLRKFCQAKQIWYQSFWTLTASRRALGRPSVQAWAESKNLTPQTLMYAFLMSLGYPKPLSGTTSEEHMAQDVKVMKRLQNGEAIFETREDLKRFAEILGMPDL